MCQRVFNLAVFSTFGMCVMSLTPFSELALVVGALFFAVWLVWAGYFIPYPEMVGHHSICILQLGLPGHLMCCHSCQL